MPLANPLFGGNNEDRMGKTYRVQLICGTVLSNGTAMKHPSGISMHESPPPGERP